LALALGLAGGSAAPPLASASSSAPVVAPAPTVTGATMGENCRDEVAIDRAVIRTFDNALVDDAGFVVLGGNLFAASPGGPRFLDT